MDILTRLGNLSSPITQTGPMHGSLKTVWPLFTITTMKSMLLINPAISWQTRKKKPNLVTTKVMNSLKPSTTSWLSNLHPAKSGLISLTIFFLDDPDCLAFVALLRL